MENRPNFLDLPAFKSFEGTLRVPGSKSISNRALLLSALAKGETRLHYLLLKSRFNPINDYSAVILRVIFVCVFT